MQNLSIALTAGVAEVTPPSHCNSFLLVGSAAFNFTYYEDQIPVGDAAPAVPYGAAFVFRVVSRPNTPFKTNLKYGKITGGGAGPVFFIPDSKE